MLRQIIIFNAFCVFFVASMYVVNPGPKYPPTKGEVWPKPQQQTKFYSYYKLLPSIFKFRIMDESCHILNVAIDRYSFALANLYDIVARRSRRTWMLDVERPKHSEVNYAGHIEELQVTLSKPCEEYPQENMDEKYNIKVRTESTLQSASIWGILRGLETFFQLFYISNDFKNIYINKTQIVDYPQYLHRGLLIDTSRHYITVPTIMKLLDGMEMNKMNVLHWHIVDDQSFPYRSDKFPQLSVQGAYDSTMVYSKADINRLVNYARDRGIRVIPEFDVPGHTRSWGQAYPNILTKCYQGGVEIGLGPMDPTNNMTYKLIAELFEEVRELFPDTQFHVGGDEVELNCWKSNPKIMEFMKKLDMSSTKQLHAYFMKRVLEIMGPKTTSIVWQEVFDEGAAWYADTIIQVWKSMGSDELIEILNSGHRLIYSSAWYLDHLSTGGDWTDFYNVDPRRLIPTSLTEINKNNIIGGEACMWGEVVDDNNVISRVWPRTCAVAEKLWSTTDDFRYNRMYGTPPREVFRRLEEQACRMIRRNIHVQPPSGPGFCVAS